MKKFSPSAIAILFAIPLLVLTGLVWTGTAESFDHVWRQAMLDIDPTSAVKIWKGLTYLGSGVVITTLTTVFLLTLMLLKQWRSTRQVALVMTCAVALENAMKWIVQRPRPDEIIAYATPGSFSFPSGHALFATAFYGSFALIVSAALTGWSRAAVNVAIAIVVLAIGTSRIFLGVHYPSDVIAGFLAGALCLTPLFPPPASRRTHWDHVMR